MVPEAPGAGRRRGEGPLVHLPVLVEGKRVEEDEGRGNHVLGERLPQSTAHLPAELFAIPVRHDVGDEAAIPWPSPPGDHHVLADLGLLGQRGLDLSQLDAETADLDLLVDAAQVLEVPAREPAAEVPAPVETRLGIPGKRVAHETLGRQLGPVQVPSGHPRTPRRTSPRGHRGGRARLPRPARKPAGPGSEPRSRSPPSLHVLPLDPPVGHVHCRLRDPVHVDQLRPIGSATVDPRPQALEVQCSPAKFTI